MLLGAVAELNWQSVDNVTRREAGLGTMKSVNNMTDISARSKESNERDHKLQKLFQTVEN